MGRQTREGLERKRMGHEAGEAVERQRMGHDALLRQTNIKT